jgi:hypothetical protein
VVPEEGHNKMAPGGHKKLMHGEIRSGRAQSSLYLSGFAPSDGGSTEFAPRGLAAPVCG